MIHSLFFPAFLAIIFISSCCIFPHAESHNGNKGFTVDLIHRDSPNSPFYDPLSTPFQGVRNAYQRSLWRSRKFTSPAGLIPDDGEYLLKIGLGTPPFDFYAIADTGSDTSWVQCLPCVNCYKERFPPFNPNKSSTFQYIACESKQCDLLPANSRSCKPTKTCLYNESYGDNSFTKGDLVSETLTFFGSGNQEVSFPNVLFGCGHENGGTFTQNTSGLVGFGTRNLSLSTQLKCSIQGKFSFCLGPSTQVSKSGKLSFGSNAVVTGPGSVSTPLIIDEFYYLILDAISVGNKRFDFPTLKESSRLGGGNIIIDSGTTYTFLPTDLYTKVEKAVKGDIQSNNTVKDPLGIFPLCYSSLKDSDIPLITFHFKGAYIELKPLNTFVNTSPSTLCLAFVSTTDLPVYGNVIQMNFLVGYDIVNKIISFKNIDCTK